MLNRRKSKQSAPGFIAEALEDRRLLNAADLDTSFGVNLDGVQTTQFTGYGQQNGESLAVQSDGKTVIAGFAYSSGIAEQIVLARYNTNGTLDTTFGAGGKELIPVIVSVGVIANYSQANAVAIQPDGKIVIAGYMSVDNATSYQMVVGRVNANGAIDGTFGNRGFTIFNSPSSEVATSIAIAGSGNIVIGGLINRGTSHFVLARVTSTGAPDPNFGSGGIAVDTYSTNVNSADAINSLAFDSSGNLYAAVDVGNSASTSVIGVAKFTSSGDLDFNYGSGGVALTTVHATIFGLFAQRAAIAIQSNGMVDLAGGSNSFSAARFTTFGELDSNFGANGVFTYIGHVDTCTAIGLYSNGDLVLTGTSSTTGSTLVNYPMELRLTSAGALDTTFNTTGVSIINGSPTTVTAAVLLSTGTVRYVGYSTTVQCIVTAGFFFNGTGSDGNFGYQGLEIPTAVAGIGKTAMLQSDGKLVVAGTYNYGVGFSQGQQGVVTRFNSNGQMDYTFGVSGFAYLQQGGTFNLQTSVLQANGDIVVEGTAFDPMHTSSWACVQRLLPTGKVDTAFASGGTYVLDGSKGFDTFTNAAALLTLPDNSLLAITNSSNGGQITKISSTGQTVTSYGTLGTGVVKDTHQWTSAVLDSTGLPILNDGSLERYTAAGLLDTTFSNGISAPVGAGNTAMTIQSDGKILSTTPAGATLRRFTTQGSWDSTFGSNGNAAQPFANVSYGAVAVMLNGNILVAGRQNSGGVACIAYDTAGNPISAFGSGGIQAFSAETATNAIAVGSNGKIYLVGQSNGAQVIIALKGALPAVVPGSSSNDTFTLSQSSNHQLINWTVTSPSVTRSGSIPIADAAGIMINGNGGAADVINLNSTNGNPLPAWLQVNGTFTLNGLSATNPLANTTLDINNSTVFITYASPALDPLATLRDYLKNGYNAGAWTGVPTASTGVITSTSAAADPTHSMAIGYADSADGLIPLPANTIELRYTLYGDTSLTAAVGFTDFMRMTQHFTTTTGATWGQGDFNYDGAVDTNDFNLLKPNYGMTLPAPTPTPPPVMTPIVVATTNSSPVLGTTERLLTPSTGDALDNAAPGARSAKSKKLKTPLKKPTRKHA